MTTINFNMAIDMSSLNRSNDIPVFLSSTLVVVDHGSLVSSYSGVGFTFSGNTVTGGTLTGYTETLDGQTVLEATGFAVPASTAGELIQSNGPAALLPFILSGNDTINGSAFDDVLLGYGGNDIIKPGAGHNTVYGGDGVDTVVLSGNASQYSITANGDIIAANKNDNSSFNNLNQVERLHFDDGTLAFDTSGDAGQAYRIYQAAFNRTPDTQGLSFWVNQMDKGATLLDVAKGFIQSAEFSGAYGDNVSNPSFVSRLYENVLHRSGDSGGIAYWNAQLSAGMTKAQVLIGFSESAENVSGVSPHIDHGIWLV